MSTPKHPEGRTRHDDETVRRPDDAPRERPADVRQDDELTNAERLPRRGDHELPPGNDSSV